MTVAEQTALMRAAKGIDVDEAMSAALIRHGYVFRTSWGKLALTSSGVAAMQVLRSAGLA